ncbi:unnamed protein product [Linum tenue]|uniref:Fucosyltransferase n=1 Tax=Linum tenue TaxID=586396 RepID=A0AAV0KHF6_9ROSI|nr:unnamed protein product [Linum tenue]
MSFLLLASITSPNPFSDLTQKFFPSQNDKNSSPAQELPQDQSCISRSQKISYHKKSPSPVPSSYFLSKLRDHERRHKNCEPFSEPFNRTLQLLISGKNAPSNVTESDYCRYLVYNVNLNGLGNRILGLSSAFLYALLTNRVLLVDFGPDMADLFCEPFQNSTWVLPADFPFRNEFYSSQFREAHSFGSLLMKNAKFTHLAPPPSLLHLFLSFEYSKYDKLFYRDENQEFLQGVPWLTLRSDQYFIPYLFLMPCFKPELERLFPDKETVFHHLGRYLFSPSNQAWGLITRFYDAYLARADERIGLQIRVFNPTATPIPLFTKQILQCTQKVSLLPQLQESTASSSAGGSNKTTSTTMKAVLIGSLYREFYEEMKFMYWTRASVDGGQVVGFHQASHEGSQHSESHSHNMKAWADMYLLSLCDALVTSPWSTFGYVAQGIGVMKPWILNVPNDRDGDQKRQPETACTQAVSMEPCFHFPPSYDMRAKVIVDREAGLRPPVVHCEDVRWGLKLANGREN